MTPASNEHGRALAEIYRILRQAAARAAQTANDPTAANSRAGAAEGGRDDAGVTRSSR